MFRKYNINRSSSIYRRNNKNGKHQNIINIRSIGIGIIICILTIWCFGLTTFFSIQSNNNNEHPIKKIIKDSNDNRNNAVNKNKNNGGKLTPYQAWLKRRKGIALKPLEPIKKLNVSEIGKWVFRKTKDGKPHYYNRKTHEIKWIKPPKNLQSYIDKQRKETELEEGGILTLMDGLLKTRVDTDKANKEEVDDDEDDNEADKEAAKDADGTYKPLRHESIDDNDPDSGGWVYSPRQKKIDEEKKKKEIQDKKNGQDEQNKKKAAEEDAKFDEARNRGKNKKTTNKKEEEKIEAEKQKTLNEISNLGKRKETIDETPQRTLAPGHILAKPGETAKSIVAEYLEKLDITW